MRAGFLFMSLTEGELKPPDFPWHKKLSLLKFDTGSWISSSFIF